METVQKYLRLSMSQKLLVETQVFQQLLTSSEVHRRFLTRQDDKKSVRSFYRMLAQLWLSDHASISRNNPMSPQGDQKSASISSDDAFEMNMQVVE